jgi:hypothetical protein
MSPLRDKIPVEQLDDVRVGRIERNVLAAYREGVLTQPRKRSWASLLRFAIPAVAVAGVAAAIFFYVRATADDAAPALADREGPTKIVTDDEGGSKVKLGDAVVTLGLQTSVEVIENELGVSLTLVSGRVDCEVEPIEGRLPFVVHAGDVDVTVVGTVFSVERDHEVRVEVTRGKVRVDNPSGMQMVAAGERWTGPATMTAMNDFPVRVESIAAATDRDTAASAIELDTPATPDEGALAGRSSKRPSTDETKTSKATKKKTSKATKKKTKKKKPEYTDDMYKQDALAYVKIAWPSGSEELRELKELAYNEPKDAVRKLRLLVAEKKSGEAADAMFTIALIQYYKLGSARQAIKTLRQYERRFSSGEHLDSVIALRIKAQCGVAHDDKCRSAAHTYLRRFPYGDHATLAGEVVNWGM